MGEILLVHGVAWDGPEESGGRPALRLQRAGGEFHEIPLGEGDRIGWRIAAEGVHCLGYHRVQSATARTHHPCPDRAQAARGKQCAACPGCDETRLIHDFHRSGVAPPGLRDYLMQPHWLYLAASASGSLKVGTASAVRKWNRLAEQGAAQARFIALAPDGRVVRLLEDAVSRELGFSQQIRSAAKAAALLRPRPQEELSGILERAAARARELLFSLQPSWRRSAPFEAVEEVWVPPALAGPLLGGGPWYGYPQPLDAGEHGLLLRGLLGPYSLAGLDDERRGFIADLGLLRGRLVEEGEYGTELPALQDSLF